MNLKENFSVLWSEDLTVCLTLGVKESQMPSTSLTSVKTDDPGATHGKVTHRLHKYISAKWQSLHQINLSIHITCSSPLSLQETSQVPVRSSRERSSVLAPTPQSKRFSVAIVLYHTINDVETQGGCWTLHGVLNSMPCISTTVCPS